MVLKILTLRGWRIPLSEFEEPNHVFFRHYKNVSKIVSKMPFGLKKNYPFTITLNSHLMSGDSMKLLYPGVTNLLSFERNGKVERISDSYIYL